MSIDDHTKPRVNGSLLPNFHGKQVCLLGVAKDVDSGGNFFTLTTCDNQDIRIQMQEPLRERVSGLTEVTGTVRSKTSLEAENVVVFSEEASANFDASLYQKAIEVSQRHPNFYIQSGHIED
ncbi:uncharacterized protein LOC101852861 [Aplysia californica]|uniref:Uncharacterized protein LOC101852861 n=1 Tax=Aplysia californica TaxID=6500 RepID=A0ABM0JTH4_APLCA|nr:uncharacterized protein LOC101852861 [Aplysia californica]